MNIFDTGTFECILQSQGSVVLEFGDCPCHSSLKGNWKSVAASPPPPSSPCSLSDGTILEPTDRMRVWLHAVLSEVERVTDPPRASDASKETRCSRVQKKDKYDNFITRLRVALAETWVVPEASLNCLDQFIQRKEYSRWLQQRQSIQKPLKRFIKAGRLDTKGYTLKLQKVINLMNQRRSCWSGRSVRSNPYPYP